jgi:hypothetical protein
MSTKSKRVWLTVGAVILAAIIFRDTFGVLVTAAIFWAAVLAALFGLPAFVGTVAGSTVGDVVRWVRRWQHRRFMRGYAKRVA